MKKYEAPVVEIEKFYLQKIHTEDQVVSGLYDGTDEFDDF